MSFSKKIIIFSFCFILSGLWFVLPVLAEEETANEELPSPLGENVELATVIGRAIKVVLGLVGVLALIMFIYGGITWMTSAGNIEQVKRGKNTLVWAVLGLAIVFLAYSLVTFLIKKILGQA